MTTKGILRLSACILNNNSKAGVTFSQLRWLRTNSRNLLTTSLCGVDQETSSLQCLDTSCLKIYDNRVVKCEKDGRLKFLSTLSRPGFVTSLMLRYGKGEGGETKSLLHTSLISQRSSSEQEEKDMELNLMNENDSLGGGDTSDSSLNSEISSPLGLTPAQDEAVEDKSLPEMSRTVYNLAPYVQRSKTLQFLVKLGVDLSKVEKVRGMASLLVMSDFDKDILPYLQHLIRAGVQPNKLGYILTVNPRVLTEYIQHLEQRVGYLVSKEFSISDVASMYTRAPVMISMDPVKLDQKLGFLQQAFGLTGSEVRQVALTFPKILPWRKENIAAIRFNLKEFMGFEDKDLKLMLLKDPKLFTGSIHNVKKNFEYVHNTMLVPHSLIVKWPSVLRCRLRIAKERHLFLLHLGKAQYNPYKENFVSMKSLIGCIDDDFCKNVAKSTEDEFVSFLKML